MDSEKFSVDEAIVFGWDQMKKNFVVLLGILSAAILFTMFPPVLGFAVSCYVSSDAAKVLLGLLLGLAVAILNDLIALGMINVQLRLVDGKKAQTPDLFAVLPQFWNYVFATIMFKVAMVCGYICFIVPGIIVQLTFQFYGYLIIDRGLGPIQALKTSAAITRGAKWNLFFLGLALALINWVGFMSFLILAFPAYAISVFATTYAYRELFKNTSALPLCAQHSISAEQTSN